MVFGVLLVLGILALLQAAPRRWRKGIVAAFTFLGGLYYAVEFFLPTKNGENILTPSQPVVANISNVIQSFAIGLGIVSLMQFHSKAIQRRREGWGNSVALLIAFVAMVVFGLMNAYAPTKTIIPRLSFTQGRQTAHDVYLFLFNGGLQNLDAAMFSIVAFYIASASYRAFRIRSVESTLLMVSALIVMLGSVTFGTALTNWIAPHDPDSFAANFRVERVANWLLTVVNSAAQRGILFGLTLGGLAVSLRYWLSLERGSYFEKEL